MHIRPFAFLLALALPACAPPLDSSAPGDIVCEAGVSEACYSGASETRDIGSCRAGVRTCAADGSGFGACKGEVLPQAESCNGSDDLNCDGTTACHGNPRWKLGLTGEIAPAGIAASSDGEATVFGWAKTIDIGAGPQGDPEVWSLFVARVSGDGSARWLHTFAGVDAAERSGGAAMSEAHEATIVVRVEGQMTIAGKAIDASQGGVLALRFEDDGTLAAAELLDLSGPAGTLAPSPKVARLAGDGVIVGGAGFLAQVDAALTTTWHHRYAGDVTVADITSGSDGAMFATGSYAGEFEPGGGAEAAVDHHAAFIAELEGDGILWSERLGGEVETTGLSLLVRADGTLRVAGIQAGGGNLIEGLELDPWGAFVADRNELGSITSDLVGLGPRRPDSITIDLAGHIVTRAIASDKAPTSLITKTLSHGQSLIWMQQYEQPPVSVTLPSGETVVATAKGVERLAL